MSRQTGEIVQSFGRQFIVETTAGRLTCTTRGKKTEYACGDRVSLQVSNAEQGVIEKLEPRQSLLYRQDAFRQKLIAANVTQILVVVSPWPAFGDEFLHRCLLAAEAAAIRLRIVLNKIDLPNVQEARNRLRPVLQLGFECIELSATQHAEDLRPWLAGETSVLVGQSGMGKSTLINALIPEARARVGDVSAALSAGTHTTTHATLYTLEAGTRIIDVPGFQEFGLHHITRRELAWHFPELRPLVDQCRFGDCRHLKEPDCAVRAALQRGDILPARYALYERLMQELAE